MSSHDGSPDGAPGLHVVAIPYDDVNSRADDEMSTNIARRVEPAQESDDDSLPAYINDYSDREDDAYFQHSEDMVKEKWDFLHMKSQHRKARLRIAQNLIEQQSRSMEATARHMRKINGEIEKLNAQIEKLRTRRALHTEIVSQVL